MRELRFELHSGSQYRAETGKLKYREIPSQKEKTSLGPVISNLGVRPLKKEVAPSFLIMLDTIRNPLSGFSKFLFWIRVLMTSNGAETTRDAVAPAIDAMKFCPQVAAL
jgi:hypothetical protein